MRVLALNCGSSTLKFQLLEAGQPGVRIGEEPELAQGLVERVGSPGAAFRFAAGDERRQWQAEAPTYAAALGLALDWLAEGGFLQPGGLGAAAHRVVNGGHLYSQPTRIDASVIEGLSRLIELAPLHNGPAIETIRAAWERLGPSLPMVATFDTTFHRAMPERARRYALPLELADKHHLERYGAHGLAHEYMARRYAALVNAPLERLNLVTLQLGNGSSACAVRGGLSVDTSMGFTPLEGLMMGTRSGDLDPAIVGYLAQHEGVSVAQVETWLNRESGLLGVSGRSGDMRDLLEAESQGDARAALAIEMYCYRVRKYIGAYLAALGGADAVIFGGGIGEHAPSVRARACSGLAWAGLTVNAARNAALTAGEGEIGAAGDAIRVFVVPVNEAAIMARQAAELLERG